MDGNLLRIAFFGTPAFAASSLAALLAAGHRPVVVVTAPDRPAGRGRQLQQSAVKQLAQAEGLDVLQPEKLKSTDFLEALASYDLDVGIVVAFRMLPEVVFNMPRLGMFNLHASLLPQYRGAAPINWAIIRGEVETGVTTFRIQQDIDTGGLYMQERVAIPPHQSAGELHDVLAELGASLVVRTVEGLGAGTLQAQAQAGEPSHAPKLNKEVSHLNFHQPAAAVANFVRGLSPYPAAWCSLHGKQLKVLSGSVVEMQHSQEPGTVIGLAGSLVIACQPGAYAIEELQLEGKKPMPAADFLRGYTVNVGEILT